MLLGLVSCASSRELDKETEKPSFLDEIGISYQTLLSGHPDAEIEERMLPDAAAVCLADPALDYAYYLYPTQSIPFQHLEERIKNELVCAGFATTVGTLFPNVDDSMATDDFFSAIGVSEYHCVSEIGPAMGWITFQYHGLNVYLDATVDSVTQNEEYVGVQIIKCNYPIVIYDSILESQNYDLSEEGEQLYEGSLEYWAYDDEFAFTMPSGLDGETKWYVGLGEAYDFDLGVPYDLTDVITQPAEDLVALSWSDVVYRYYDGLKVVTLTGFYGNQAHGFIANQYIATSQPDCKTNRGISVGNSIADLLEAYPEVVEQTDYVFESEMTADVAVHNRCFVFAPQGTNRSILFLLKEDTIVQIDMADGLDGQIFSPAIWWPK